MEMGLIGCLRGAKATVAAVGVALAMFAGAPAVTAAEPTPLTLKVEELATDRFIADIREWATAPVVLSALKGRNERAGKLTQAEIDALDKQWRAETKKDDQPLITSVLANPLSSFLYRVQARSVGLFTEIFVMDQNGLNVGQSAITSDYWQGDEAKFQKTAGVGPSAVFVDEAEFHDGTRTWRAQINLTVDGDDGAPIGAITVEVNLTELERRRLAGLGS